MKNAKYLSLFLSVIFCLVLVLGSVPLASAEDCFTINVDILDMDCLNNDDYVAANLSAQTQGIRVQKNIGDVSVSVRLMLVQMDTNTLLFDKNYGDQSGSFDSGIIYLPYVDNRTIPYLVTLMAGDTTYAMPFMHLQPRMTYNLACTYGVRIRDLDPSLTSDWLMGTMVDLNELRLQGSMTVPVCASNQSIIGQATILMQEDALQAQLAFLTSADVSVNYVSLYVVTDCGSMRTADVQSIDQPARSVGEWVDVSGASSALVYLPMQISYDSDGLNSFSYDLNDYDLQRQVALWGENRSGAGVSPTPEAFENGHFDEFGNWIEMDGLQEEDGWEQNSGWADSSGADENGSGEGNSGWDSGLGGWN